jgi:hypothetical protein
MKKLLALGAALVFSGVVIPVVSLVGQVYAQGTEVDVEKLKQILNETRTAIEANDDPGALTQLDLADEVLSGNSNMSASSNMTNTTAIITG